MSKAYLRTFKAEVTVVVETEDEVGDLQEEIEKIIMESLEDSDIGTVGTCNVKVWHLDSEEMDDESE